MGEVAFCIPLFFQRAFAQGTQPTTGPSVFEEEGLSEACDCCLVKREGRRKGREGGRKEREDEKSCLERGGREGGREGQLCCEQRRTRQRVAGAETKKGNHYPRTLSRTQNEEGREGGREGGKEGGRGGPTQPPSPATYVSRPRPKKYQAQQPHQQQQQQQ